MGNCFGRKRRESTVSIVRTPIVSPWISAEEREIASETYYLVDKWLDDIKNANPSIKTIPDYLVDQKQREFDAIVRTKAMRVPINGSERHPPSQLRSYDCNGVNNLNHWYRSTSV